MDETKAKLPASNGQRGVYREITGRELPADATRAEAVKAIKLALAIELRAEEELDEKAGSAALQLARGRHGSADKEIVEGRLYTVPYEQFRKTHLKGVTVLVNLTNDPDLLLTQDGAMTVQWWAADNVDERVLEGLVRLISSAMKGTRQKVLLVGAQDAVDTVSACVLREYTGAHDLAAISAVRRARGGDSLTRPGLRETIKRYRPS